MKAIRMALCIVVLLMASGVLHAQLDRGGFMAWQAQWLSNPGDPHFYLSGNLIGLDPINAHVRIGIGGVFAQFDVTAQACFVDPVGNVNPLGQPNGMMGPQAGDYSEIVLATQMAPGANAIRISLTPIGYPGPGAGGTLNLAIPITNLNALSNIGAATADTTCPADCKKVSGTCSGRCGTLGPKCCRGLRVLLDCVNCRIVCQDGDC